MGRESSSLEGSWQEGLLLLLGATSAEPKGFRSPQAILLQGILTDR